ncbi:MAG TPA: FeoA family protein [Synergistaceae bacterium]|jgi:ferrous iron transport protein A|nr:FeoA family protein [Synergistaceae bacterium]
MTMLCTLANGQTAKITALPPGMSGRRLEALGLRPGKVVTKVSGMPFFGPVTIALDGRQIAIGHGICCKVSVEPLAERNAKG